MRNQFLFILIVGMILTASSGFTRDPEAKLYASWEYVYADWDEVKNDSKGLVLASGRYDSSNKLVGVYLKYLDKNKNSEDNPKYEGTISNTTAEPNYIPTDISKTDSDKGFHIIGVSRRYVVIMYNQYTNGIVTNRYLYSYTISSKIRKHGSLELGAELPEFNVYKNTVMLNKADIVRIYDIRLNRIKTTVNGTSLSPCEIPQPVTWSNVETGEIKKTITVYK